MQVMVKHIPAGGEYVSKLLEQALVYLLFSVAIISIFVGTLQLSLYSNILVKRLWGTKCCQLVLRRNIVKDVLQDC